MVAKIAKIQLEMKNGVKVRTISELKDNFDAEKLVGYYLDGKLKKWLETRWYEEELNALEALQEDDCLLTKHLCEIFGIEYVDEEMNSEEIAEKSIKISKVKQYTEDEEIIKNIEYVAFNQEELADLYEKDVEKIYLCEGEFKIPKSKKDLVYICIGAVVVEGLDDKNMPCREETKFKRAVDLYKNKQYQDAKTLFEYCSKKGNAEAMWYLGVCNEYGYGATPNTKEAYTWYLKSAEAGYAKSMNAVAICYEEGTGVAKDEKNAFLWYSKAADAGEMYAMYNLGRCYENGIGICSDRAKQLYWYEKSSSLGHGFSMGKMAEYYTFTYGEYDENKALYWAQKGGEKNNQRSIEIMVYIFNRNREFDKVFSLLEPRAQKGDVRAMITLYEWYSTGRVDLKPYRNYRKAFQWLVKAAEAGDLNSMNALGNLYNSGNWGISRNSTEANKWWKKADLATEMWNSYDK